MVDLPTCWAADSVPAPLRRIEPVDRVPHVQVGDARLQGDMTTVPLRAFVEYTGQQKPEVWLDGVRMDVRRRLDDGINEWAASSEDQSEASFLAVGPVGLWSGAGPFEVVVRLSGASVRLPASKRRADPSDARAVVSQASLVQGSLRVTGTSPSGLEEAWLSGPMGSTVRADVRMTGQRFTVDIPLSTQLLGTTVLLPYGQYRLHLSSQAAEGADARSGVTWSRALMDDPPWLVTERQRLSLVGADWAQVKVGPPLRAHEAGAFGQRLGRTIYGSGAGIQGRTVLLETFRGRAVGDSPGAIGRELMSRDIDLDLVCVVDDASVAVPEGLRAVVRLSHDWYRVLGSARAYVANAAAPAFFAKKPGQIHLQTWHGTPLKRIGEDRGPGDFFTWRHRRMVARQASDWDALLSPSRYCSEIFRSAFRYDGVTLESGYPRNDVLTSASAGDRRREVRTRLGILEQDTVVLYAPTWREYLGERDAKPLYLDPETVTRGVKECVVLMRGHYNATGQPDAFRGRRDVQDVTRYPDIADLFLACDVLVTDYSSVMFDFSLTDKPVILLVPDLERYRDAERGFYLDIDEWAPGPLVRSTEEVVAMVDDLATLDSYGPARSRLRQTFCPWDDGLASKRVADHLLDLMRLDQ
jgi:CDP-glycerol glycerophosphotransferase